MAQKRHGRHHAQVRLTVLGKDGQEEDRIGMEMQRLQPIVVADFIKEIREGRNQPNGDAAREEGEEGAPLRLRLIGCKPKLRLPPLVALSRCQRVHGGEALLCDGGRLKSGLVPSRCRGSLDLARRHGRQMQSKVGADLEVAAAKSEKGDLE